MTRKVVVLGAGPAGYVCAIRLAQLGYNKDSVYLQAAGIAQKPAEIESNSPAWQRWAVDSIKQIAKKEAFKGKSIVTALRPDDLFIDDRENLYIAELGWAVPVPELPHYRMMKAPPKKTVKSRPTRRSTDSLNNSATAASGSGRRRRNNFANSAARRPSRSRGASAGCSARRAGSTA